MSKRCGRKSADAVVPSLDHQSRREGLTISYKKEPTMTSTRPKPQQLAFDFSDEVVSPDAATSELQPEQSRSAAMEKPALDSVSLDLMERIVDDGNMERAWKKVKANRGAPGPDGITLDEFFETFRLQWPEVRRQLLEGTYRPGPARRKAIPKPDGVATSTRPAKSRNSKRD